MFRFLPRNTDPAAASWGPVSTSRRVVLPAPVGAARPVLSPLPPPRTRGTWVEGEPEGARGGRRRFRRLAPHPPDPQLAGEHLLVHLAGLELLDDRELALQFLLVSVALRLPGPRDRVALHPIISVV